MAISCTKRLNNFMTLSDFACPAIRAQKQFLLT
jgi:hypothetical protein